MDKKRLFITSIFLFNVIGTTQLQVNSDFLVNSIINEKQEKKFFNSIYFENVDVTMYNPVESQTDNDPYVTADMSRINKNNPSSHKWIAISRDLHVRYGGDLHFGDTVYLYGTYEKDGFYIVRDLMNERFTKRIDILESIGTPWYKYSNSTCFIFYSKKINKNELIDNRNKLITIIENVKRRRNQKRT
jgi:hypothetical protein